ncbi:MAG TPA: PEP-CTERM sorting domain-containing protein [Capsulimonadaceae bacterium]|nr:PEP-CTERM sorting domain-containing protein [Capsulimonadaceae bacterium]
MSTLRNTGPVLAIMSFIAAVTTAPALAVPRIPAPVPEPSPIVAFAAGGLILTFCLFLKFRAQRRQAARQDN